MIEFVDWLSRLGTWSAGAVWIPMLTWTLLAPVLLWGLRRWRRAHPLLQCDVRSVLLLALPLGIVLAAFVEVSIGQLPEVREQFIYTFAPPEPLPPAESAPVVAAARPSVTVAAPAVAPGVSFWIGLGTLLAGLGALVGLGWLFLDAWSLRRWRRKARALADETLAGPLRPALEAVRVKRPVRYAVAEESSVPLTFGWLRPTVILPERLLADDAAARMALCHELIHIRRWDYLRLWAERLVRAVFCVHPLVWLLSGQIHRYREYACDAEVLLRLPCERKAYAGLLLDVALAGRRRASATLPMASPGEDLKRRIMALNEPGRSRETMRSIRLQNIFMAAALLGLVVTAITVTDIDISAPVKGLLNDTPAGGNAEGVVGAMERRASVRSVVEVEGPGYHQRVEGGFEWVGLEDQFHYLYMANRGLVVFSAQPFTGALPVGPFTGGVLRFQAGAVVVEASPQPAPSDDQRSVFVRHYAEYGALWQGIGGEQMDALQPEVGARRLIAHDARGRSADGRDAFSKLNITFMLGRVSRLNRLMAAVARGRAVTPATEVPPVEVPPVARTSRGISLAPIRINGKHIVMGSAWTDALSGYAYFVTPRHGRVIVSGVPFEGARRQAVAVGNRLTVTWQGTTLLVENDGPVVGPEVTPLWVRRDLGFQTVHTGTGAGDDVSYMRRLPPEATVPAPLRFTPRQ